MGGVSKTVRQRVRGWALDGLVAFYRLTGRIPPPEIPRVQFVYFHYVYDEQVPKLKALLAWMECHFTVISYSEAVERLCTDRVDDVYAALSFDDGLRHTSLNAARVLEERGLSACFFICPGVVGESHPRRIELFWERISHPPAEVINWSEVESLLDSGHEIGSHTHTHRNLAEVDRETADRELRRSRELLEEAVGTSVHFAWPYGRFEHISREVVDLARGASYASLASAERGCHVQPVSGAESLCVRRDHVHLDWPLEHVKFFLARNAVCGAYQENGWPEHLEP